MGRLVHFANIPLRIVRPESLENIKEVVFRTVPSVNKVEIRRYLESLYGLEVDRVHTMNYEGKKKRSRFGFYRRPDWKKVVVELKNPVTLPENVFLGVPNREPEEVGAAASGSAQ
ncbi:hypothetical protein CLOM_g6561 [Closterium sp. NIES-68]|nr:hypothetical protein CLOM_g6561 [Closterium sp. NIES-68]GJP75715.1 hypothetical protein CLOP_g6124 [Closterium sp. NIES-67]